MFKKPRAVALIRHNPRDGDYIRRHLNTVLGAYAAAHAWGEPEFIVDESGPRFLEGGEPRHILKSLTAGTRAVVADFSHLAETPSELLAGVPKVIGMGIELHVTELFGPVAQHLPALATAWAHAAPIEEALAAEKKEHAEDKAKFLERFDEFQRDVMANAVRRFGMPAQGFTPIAIPQDVAEAFALPPGGASEPTEARGELDFAPVGMLLRRRREAHGLTQQALATMISTTPSTVSRLESTGSGAKLEDALMIVAPEVLPDDEVRTMIDVPVFLLHRAKAELDGTGLAA